MASTLLAARVVALSAGAGLLAAAWWVWTRRTGHTVGPFALLLAVTGASALALAATADAPRTYQLTWLFTLLAVPLAFGPFALSYYGGDHLATRTRLAGYAAPGMVAAAAGSLLSFDPATVGAGGRALTRAMMTSEMTGGDPDMMTAPLTAATGVRVGPLSPVTTDVALAARELGLYYASGVTLAAVGVVVLAVLRYDHLPAGLGLALAFVGLWPWLAYAGMPAVAVEAGWQAAVAVVSVSHGLSLLAVGLAVGPYGLFEAQPAAGTVGPATALDALDDAVVVLDDDGRVLRTNAAADRTFDPPSTPVGRPVEALVGVDADRLRTGAELELETVDGTRQFEPTASPVPGRGGSTRGSAVVLRDVTRRRTREQRLQVLTRVLRHNLRNDLTVVRGQADLIPDGEGSEAGVERIRSAVEDMVSLSERAREAQRMMELDAPADPRTEVAAAVTDVAGAVRERYPDVEVTVAVPDGLVAAVDQRVLEVVLENLLDNACEHTDAASPVVVVSADRTGDDELRVAVSDNGPGIPEMEVAAVTGGETPLEHASGLGLWTVRWGVTRMGGRLSFEENAPRGTVVEVTLPAADVA